MHADLTDPDRGCVLPAPRKRSGWVSGRYVSVALAVFRRHSLQWRHVFACRLCVGHLACKGLVLARMQADLTVSEVGFGELRAQGGAGLSAPRCVRDGFLGMVCSQRWLLSAPLAVAAA